ncbi:hypothetical protein [Meiothermus hypogaeus]|uniref:Uncharacterized protein n=2 Tax=Meiothermus hypogaeus TaxID=884155 RepID=A0A511R6C0_9DEIN|nr:hypothetical protein [Meiothermus hypogaeus]RIH78514.1 hypothetical protein Mhypo_01510 [Meiothermus hypogaeus]GEM84462.1 hypothetical protein MHY01S_26280 [Meiothermus hypogaeus NBRC 106114]
MSRLAPPKTSPQILASYILKLEAREGVLLFVLHDLRGGERLVFDSAEALKRFLERSAAVRRR